MSMLRVASEDGTTVAELAPHAGMVCCSLRHHGEELLDPRDGIDAYAERGSTMGIPLLYPWANRLGAFEYRVGGRSVTLTADRSRISLDPNGLPIHGVLPGRMRWRTEPRRDESTLSARLEWSSPDLLELFPFVHELSLEAVVASGTLTVSTIVRASGEDTVPVSFGYHPYLRLPGSARTSWRVELPASRRLLLDARMIPTGEREPFERRSFELADTSWDDGFDLFSGPARFTVTSGARGIAVELLKGFSYGQIYAPAGRDFICFEPMTAPTNALCSGDGFSRVKPGDEYRAVFRVVAWSA